MIMKTAGRIQVHPLEVRGQKFEVFVTEAGYFEAEYNGQDWAGESREALRDRLMRATRKDAAKIAVPFVTRNVQTGRVKAGTVTGQHASNENMLVTWADGTKSQEGSIRGTLRPLDASERAEWDRLYAEATGAARALRAFESDRELSLRRAVDKAMAESMAALPA
jgi:hypothetical protein